MSTLFHMNPHTGVVSRCRAVGKCPFRGVNGEENHFATIAEGRARYEALMADATFAAYSATPLLEQTLEKSPELEQVDEALGKLEEKQDKFTERLQKLELKANGRHYKLWYQLVQERKDAYFDWLLLHRSRRGLLTDVMREAEDSAAHQAMLERFATLRSRKGYNPNWKASYDYHPAVSSKNEKYPRGALMAFSGLSQEEVEARVAEEMAAGRERTEAYRALWASLPLRQDKPLVSLDLETAGNTAAGNVDTGPYSHIIEVGYRKLYPDGHVERKSYLCGLPENVLSTVGTGAQDVHGITPEMIQGLTPFNRDGEKQASLLADLKGSVLVAHNASFEVNQFSHNLPGFNKALATGKVEVLDTRDVVRFFVPQAATGSNQAFVEATGGTYAKAHRAEQDALMTLNALLRSKGLAEVQ